MQRFSLYLPLAPLTAAVSAISMAGSRRQRDRRPQLAKVEPRKIVKDLKRVPTGLWMMLRELPLRVDSASWRDRKADIRPDWFDA